MSTVDETAKGMQGEYAKNVVNFGTDLIQHARIPTGIFPFDLATGGGIPLGLTTIIYGPENSWKTTTMLRALATAQQMYPHKKAVLIDIEGRYNDEWGALQGIDNDKLIYVLPEYGEQAVDIVEAFLEATDLSILGVDSLAALLPIKEKKSSAEDMQPGQAGLLIGKMYRKATLAATRGRAEGTNPTLVMINQIRYKIGVMFGNPETVPGGMPWRFGASLTVRLWAKDIQDPKIHPTLPAWKLVTGRIEKATVPCAAKNFEASLCLVNHDDFNIGESDDWKTIKTYAEALGHMEKIKGGYRLYDKEFKTLKAMRAVFNEEVTWSQTVRKHIIEEVVMTGGAAIVGDGGK